MGLKEIRNIHKQAGKPKEKKIYRLRQFTPKRAVEQRKYDKKARAFRLKNPFCMINSPVCTKLTQGVNHKKGKDTIEDLLDEKEYEPACNPCNEYCESHRSWAEANGHRKSKHTIDGTR